MIDEEYCTVCPYVSVEEAYDGEFLEYSTVCREHPKTACATAARRYGQYLRELEEKYPDGAIPDLKNLEEEIGHEM